MRNKNFKGLRFPYLADERTFVVKFVVGVSHELAHRRFAKILMRKVVMMSHGMDLADIGRIRFPGLGSQKEADTAFKPTSRHRNGLANRGISMWSFGVP